jgi:hypothetical protein
MGFSASVGRERIIAVSNQKQSSTHLDVDTYLFEIFPSALLLHSAGPCFGLLSSRQCRRAAQAHAEEKDADCKLSDMFHFLISQHCSHDITQVTAPFNGMWTRGPRN